MEDEAMEIDLEMYITCRLCVEEKGKYQITAKLRDMVKFALDIDVIHYDGLSQVICETCMSLVKLLHEAKENYQIKQKLLREKVRIGVVKSKCNESVSSGSSRERDFDSDTNAIPTKLKTKGQSEALGSSSKEESTLQSSSKSEKPCDVVPSEDSHEHIVEENIIEESKEIHDKTNLVISKPNESVKIGTTLLLSDEKHRKPCNAESHNFLVTEQLRKDKLIHVAEDFLVELESTDEKKIQNRSEIFVSHDTEWRGIGSRVEVESSSKEGCQSSSYGETGESLVLVEDEEQDAEDFACVPEKLTVENNSEYKKTEDRKKQKNIHGEKRKRSRPISFLSAHNSSDPKVGSSKSCSHFKLKENNSGAAPETIILGNENTEKQEIPKQLNKRDLLQRWSQDYDRVYVCRYCNRRFQDKNSVSDHVHSHENLIQKRLNLTPYHSVIEMTECFDIDKCTQSSRVVVIDSEKLVRGDENADYYELYTLVCHDDLALTPTSTKQNTLEDAARENLKRKKLRTRVSIASSASDDVETPSDTETDCSVDRESVNNSFVKSSQESVTKTNDRNSKHKFALNFKYKSRGKPNTNKTIECNCDTSTKAYKTRKNLNSHYIIEKIIADESLKHERRKLSNYSIIYKSKLIRERRRLRRKIINLESGADYGKLLIHILNALKRKNMTISLRNPEQMKESRKISNYVRIHPMPLENSIKNNLTGFEPLSDNTYEENSHVFTTDLSSIQHGHATKRSISLPSSQLKATVVMDVAPILHSPALKNSDNRHSDTPNKVSNIAYEANYENSVIQNERRSLNILQYERSDFNSTSIQDAVEKEVVGDIVNDHNRTSDHVASNEDIICLDSDTEDGTPAPSISSITTNLPIPTETVTASSINSKPGGEFSKTLKHGHTPNIPANKPTGRVIPIKQNIKQFPVGYLKTNHLTQDAFILSTQNEFIQSNQNSSSQLTQNSSLHPPQNLLIQPTQNSSSQPLQNVPFAPPTQISFQLPFQNTYVQLLLQNPPTTLHQIAPFQNFLENTYGKVNDEGNVISQESSNSKPQCSGNANSVDVSWNQELPGNSEKQFSTVHTTIQYGEPDEKLVKKSSSSEVTLHSPSLPTIVTRQPFEYLGKLLQKHGLHLVTEPDKDKFVTLTKCWIKLKMSLKTEIAVNLWLSLDVHFNRFRIKIVQMKGKEIKLAVMNANWQWQIMKVLRSKSATIVEQSEQRARNNDPNVDVEYVREFTTLLKSISLAGISGPSDHFLVVL